MLTISDKLKHEIPLRSLEAIKRHYADVPATVLHAWDHTTRGMLCTVFVVLCGGGLEFVNVFGVGAGIRVNPPEPSVSVDRKIEILDIMNMDGY